MLALLDRRSLALAILVPLKLAQGYGVPSDSVQ
jgi:hypothetical protein